MQFKSPAITQIDQQTHIISSQQQQTQQQPHIITKHLNNASAIVQKVIPRNILVSTGRIQNKIEVSSGGKKKFRKSLIFNCDILLEIFSRQQLLEQHQWHNINQIKRQI